MTDEPPLLLDYGITTSPNPLEADSSDNSITIAVFAPDGETVYCDEIHLSVPKYDPQHPDNPGFTEPPAWSCSSTKWEINRLWLDDETHSPQYFNITYRTKRKPDRLINYPLDFGIAGTLGPATGTLACMVEEESGTTPSDLQYRKGSFTMAVDTQTFYLNNFLARDPGKPDVPRTKFTTTDQIYLTWESNGTYFQLYDGDGTQLYPRNGSNIDKDKNKFGYTLKPSSIASDTTFILCATLTSGKPQAANGFEPLYLYATLTITLTDPTLTDLTVAAGNKKKVTTKNSDGLTIFGSTDAQGIVTVDKTLDVTGLLTAKNHLHVYTNGTRLIKTDGIGGQMDLSSLSIWGDCDVYGTSTVNEGDFSVFGPSRVKISTGDTDGLKVYGGHVEDF